MKSKASWPRCTEQITALRARWTKERDAISHISDLKKTHRSLAF